MMGGIPFSEQEPYEGLTDFERTLADICIGWTGQELGWKQYIKDNADVLLKIAIKKFNSIQDAPFEQKPAEWSEEDEKEVAVLEAYIHSKDWSERHVDRALGIVDELVNKVKSLRPQKQWKPSDEQMQQLNIVSTGKGWFDKRPLREMYEQLKKLREE